MFYISGTLIVSKKTPVKSNISVLVTFTPNSKEQRAHVNTVIFRLPECGIADIDGHDEYQPISDTQDTQAIARSEM